MADPKIGPGGPVFRDSAHLRIYANNTKASDRMLPILEAAYTCYVNQLGWQSPGLPIQGVTNSSQYIKINIIAQNTLHSGATHTDKTTRRNWIHISEGLLTSESLIHEFGHVFHYAQNTWIDQTRTGAWWETFANWFEDAFINSPICQKARQSISGIPQSRPIEFQKIIGESYRVIVDGNRIGGNYYQAWPFFTYLTHNPDKIKCLGTDVMRQLMLQYKPSSNETPLHTLQRVCGSIRVQEVIGKYWAHMAYLDIGHPPAQALFFKQRSKINYANVKLTTPGTYIVNPNRIPKYMGSNIIPLKQPSPKVTVTMRTLSEVTNHLVVYNSRTKACRYLMFKETGSIDVSGEEEVSLVIVNTPQKLILYDPFKIGSELDLKPNGDYVFVLSGATI